MIITRRRILTGLIAAPAIVAYHNIMPVKALIMPSRTLSDFIDLNYDHLNGLMWRFAGEKIDDWVLLPPSKWYRFTPAKR